jgi:hypothetical protein
VTNAAMEYAKEAVRNNWNLDDTIAALQEAWIYTHEESLRHAKWQVEQSMAARSQK